MGSNDIVVFLYEMFVTLVHASRMHSQADPIKNTQPSLVSIENGLVSGTV